MAGTDEARARAKAICEFVVEVVGFVILTALGALALILEWRGFSFRRGFFCNDDSIRFPYKPDTVPEFVLILIIFFLPVKIVS